MRWGDKGRDKVRVDRGLNRGDIEQVIGRGETEGKKQS